MRGNERHRQHFQYRDGTFAVSGDFTKPGLTGLSPDAFAWLDPILDIALPPDGTAIDVGANIGLVASMLAARLPQGRVVAIEPDADNLLDLRQTCAAGPAARIAIVPTACGAGEGWARLRYAGPYVSAQSVGSSSAEPGERLVAVQSLDAVVAQQALSRVDFIKIDVEGFEPAVLDGMSDTLARHRPWVAMEFNSVTLILAEVAPLAFLRRLANTFGSVLLVRKSGGYVPIAGEQAMAQALRTNLGQHGCVSDLILVPGGDSRIDRLRPWLSGDFNETTGAGNRQTDQACQELTGRLVAARRSNALLRRALAQLEASWSWRLTHPLRWARRQAWRGKAS